MTSLEVVVQQASVIRLVKFLDLASAVILIYDYVLTLPLEIDYVWKHPWSLIQALFYLTRYLPFVDVFISVWIQFFGGLSEHACFILYKFCAVMFCLAIAISEITLCLRTWTLYGRSNRAGYGLVTFFLVCWIPIFLFLQLFLQGIKVQHLDIAEFSGCFTVSSNQYLSICWILLMAFDAGILLATAHKAYISRPGVGGSSLLAVAYRDGIAYYIYIFTLSAVNFIVILTLQRVYMNLLSTFERAVHTVLTCRVILHLRQSASRTTSFTEPFLEQCGLGAEPMSPLIASDGSRLVLDTLRQRSCTIGGSPLPLEDYP